MKTATKNLILTFSARRDFLSPLRRDFVAVQMRQLRRHGMNRWLRKAELGSLPYRQVQEQHAPTAGDGQ